MKSTQRNKPSRTKITGEELMRYDVTVPNIRDIHDPSTLLERRTRKVFIGAHAKFEISPR